MFYVIHFMYDASFIILSHHMIIFQIIITPRHILNGVLCMAGVTGISATAAWLSIAALQMVKDKVVC